MAATDLAIPLFAFLSVASPLVYGYATNKGRRKEKLEDWAREDAVAKRLARSNQATNSKLDQIHTLVNSNMTAAMENELAAVVARLNQMEAPQEVTEAAVQLLRNRIEELRSHLDFRTEGGDS